MTTPETSAGASPARERTGIAGMTRRESLAVAGRVVVGATVARCGFSLAGVPAAGAATSTTTTVQLLGTLAGLDARLAYGSGARNGTSMVIAVGTATYLIDAGFGALRRYLEASYEVADINHVFVTQNTIDHNADVANALVFAWSSGRNNTGSNSDRSLVVSGPLGTEAHVSAFQVQQALTILDQSNNLGQTPDFSVYAQPRDIFAPAGAPVPVLSDGTVTVTAHQASAPLPALAYRITTADRDVVYTGTAGPRIDLTAFARGADTLIHEVIDPAGARQAAATLGLQKAPVAAALAARSTPAQAAALAARAGVGKLVLAGVAPGSTSDMRWLELAGSAFSGTIVVGHDLETV